MKLGIYDIFNTNANKSYSGCLRVKRDRVVMAELWTVHSNPLQFVRTHPLSPERIDLVNQLRANSITEADIKLILTLPPR